jgi:signal transduction histidine kinase
MLLADLGEIAGPLAHEVNNLLNTLTLHLAILEQQAPEASADLDALRRQIRHVAAQVARFQRHRGAGMAGPSTTALPQCAQRAAERLTHLPSRVLGGLGIELQYTKGRTLNEDTIGVWLDLRTDLPEVRGNASDLERLLRLLLVNAIRAAAVGDRQVHVHAASAKRQVQLFIDDGGPSVPQALLANIFEPGHECREGMCSLQLAACRSIIRRLEGQLEALPRNQQGLSVVVTLPSAVS